MRKALFVLIDLLIAAIGTQAAPILPTPSTSDCIGCLLAEIMVLGGDTSCVPPDMPVVSPFTIQPNNVGGGASCFVNVSGTSWTRLEVDAPLPGGTPANYACSSNLFSNCSLSLTNQSTLSFFFSGIEGNFVGIPNGAAFTIDLGSSGWLPGQAITVTANVPEPPGAFLCLLLLAEGVGMQMFRRFRRG